MKKALVSYLVIVLSVAAIAGSALYLGQQAYDPIVYSKQRMLNGLWESYKIYFLDPESSRTFDKQRNYVTTSEGQSYTMLRAVWMDDKATFDRSYEWTDEILGQRNDFLFSWLFGLREDGTYAVITEQGGYNTASDADTDIAVALLFAYARWGEYIYLYDAQNIISDIWEKEVVTINGEHYLAANDLEKNANKEYIIVNPSYIAPYAYRMFAEVDPEHPWMELVDSSYALINASVDAELDAGSTVGLPPDWIRVNKTTGEISAHQDESHSTNYGFEALRLPWRLALDWEWNREERAKDTLSRFSFLEDEWRQKGRIAGTYSHSGEVVMESETAAMYGGSIGYFTVIAPDLAEQIYDRELRVLYNPDTYTWQEKMTYYDNNWAWFGLGLHADMLPDLWSRRGDM